MLIVLNNKQMLITKKPKRKIIKEIIEEILQAIEDSFVTIAKDYISYILYIGRADVIPELTQLQR